MRDLLGRQPTLLDFASCPNSISNPLPTKAKVSTEKCLVKVIVSLFSQIVGIRKAVLYVKSHCSRKPASPRILQVLVPLLDASPSERVRVEHGLCFQAFTCDVEGSVVCSARGTAAECLVGLSAEMAAYAEDVKRLHVATRPQLGGRDMDAETLNELEAISSIEGAQDLCFRAR